MKCCLSSFFRAFDTLIDISVMMWSTVGNPRCSLEAVIIFQIPPSISSKSVFKMCLLILVCLPIFGSLLPHSFASAPAYAKKEKRERDMGRRGRAGVDNNVIQCFNWKHQTCRPGVFIFWMYFFFSMDMVCLSICQSSSKPGSGQSGCKATSLTD